MSELTSPLGADIGLNRSESLVDRLKEGDERAFEEVFELYKDMVYGLATRLLADRSEAMDVTQEVFLTLHRKIKKFRGESSLRTWLYRVALNQAANRNRWWKRRRRDRTVCLTFDSVQPEGFTQFEPGCSRPAPDRQVYSREVQESLNRCLAKLPFDQRAAIVLRDVQGLSYEEIAQLLNSQLGTIKSRIARGRERLRDLLEIQCGGSPI